MKATESLRAEHAVILNMLGCLEKIVQESKLRGSLDLTSADEALDFLTTFADRCHHGKEENVLFPALAKRGLPTQVGPIAVMLADHCEGRELRARMARAVEDARRSAPKAIDEFAAASRAYVDLMRDHIDKENSVLFPMGDGMLSPEDQSAIEKDFERVEHLDMGEGVHERYLALAERLCSRLGVEPALQKTAAHGGGCCGHKTSCGG
jgi:hemerythrin-like domain-containing protein